MCKKRTLIDLILILPHILFSKQYDWTAIYIDDAQGPLLFVTKYESYYQTNISLNKSFYDYTYFFLIHDNYMYKLIFMYTTLIWMDTYI